MKTLFVICVLMAINMITPAAFGSAQPSETIVCDGRVVVCSYLWSD